MRSMRLGWAIAGGVILLSAQAQAQVRKFDGAWSIEVVTERGNCDRAYRYVIVIENGRARYGGPEAFNVTGQVRSNGAVSGSIARGNDRADVTGRLQSAFGTGTWTASGSRTCSGRWNAEKRG
jgi:hypothetical protein